MHHVVGSGCRGRCAVSSDECDEQVRATSRDDESTQRVRAGRAGATGDHYDAHPDPRRRRLQFGNAPTAFDLKARTAQKERDDSDQILVGQVQQGGPALQHRYLVLLPLQVHHADAP